MAVSLQSDELNIGFFAFIPMTETDQASVRW